MCFGFQKAEFDLDFGPNYHPTFEIRLSTGSEEVTVKLQDQQNMVVWEHDVYLTGKLLKNVLTFSLRAADLVSIKLSQFVVRLLTSVFTQSKLIPYLKMNDDFFPSVCPSDIFQNEENQALLQGDSPKKRLFSIRPKVIESVSRATLSQLMDKLLHQGIITQEEMESVTAIPLLRDRVRKVIDLLMTKGSRACLSLIRNIQQLDPCLFESLNQS